MAALEELVVDFVLNPAAKQQYSQGNVAKKELAPYVELIRGMSQRYVNGAEAIKLNRQQLAAYALYYLPVNFAKIAFLLSKVEFAPDKTVRMLDFGCGPGTAALATAHSISQALEVSLSDASHECLLFAEKLLKSYRSSNLKLSAPLALDSKEALFDLVIAANVFSELAPEESERTLRLLLRQVDSDGYLILLVPALKNTTQDLMALRDTILSQHKEFSVLFPCSIQSACPMRAKDQDDWCHGELQNSSWNRSALLRQLDEMLAFNKHRVKYAAIVLKRAAAVENNEMVILRPATKSHPALLCGKAGLLKIDPRRIKDTVTRRLLKNGNSYQRLEINQIKKS